MCVQYNSVQLYCNAVQLNILRVVIKRTPRATSGQTVDSLPLGLGRRGGTVSVSESCKYSVCLSVLIVLPISKHQSSADLQRIL